MNVLVCGEAETGEEFTFWTHTVSVSGHGGVLLLEAPLRVGQRFKMMNEFNNRKARARIVSVRDLRENQAHAAFEFMENGENFWSMVFPASGAKPLRRLMPRVANGG